MEFMLFLIVPWMVWAFFEPAMLLRTKRMPRYPLLAISREICHPKYLQMVLWLRRRIHRRRWIGQRFDGHTKFGFGSFSSLDTCVDTSIASTEGFDSRLIERKVWAGGLTLTHQ